MEQSKVYHDWENYRRFFDGLDDPHDDEADDLDESKEMNSGQFDMTQVDVVGLVFDRRQHNQHTVIELHTDIRSSVNGKLL